MPHGRVLRLTLLALAALGRVARLGRRNQFCRALKMAVAAPLLATDEQLAGALRHLGIKRRRIGVRPTA